MKKFSVIFLSIITLLVCSCKIWMNDDNLFSDIEKEVKYATADKVTVFVRYAMSRQGKTTPDGEATLKVGIPHNLTAITEPEYGFVRWAAFPTSYLSKDNQNKNKEIYFIDDADYNTRIKPHELSSDVVVFGDPNDPEVTEKSPNTIVTIKQSRNDIYLVPIIAHRPTVSLTIPDKGSTDVVKNMSVRIQFTKPMDPESFKNEEGEYDKITVTQGVQNFNEEGDIELISEDITDHFDFSKDLFNANKKMLTLRFNEDYIAEGYTSRSSVTITISKEVKDEYGFEMTDDNEIRFSVGSKNDSLAPRITWLSAGIKEDFEAFQGVYEYEGTIENLGAMTKMKLEGANDVPEDNIEDTFFDNYIANRIGKDSNLIIRVYAEDLAGAGSNQTLDGVEADVSRIGIRAKHLYNADGTEDTESEMSSISYVPYTSLYNSTSSLSGSYRNLVNNANDLLKQKENYEDSELVDASHGSLFEYDLSNMPDGLIRIDVAAIDLVNNNGFYDIYNENDTRYKDGRNYSSEYGNGYASIFIVKDTTAPDAADENKKNLFRLI